MATAPSPESPPAPPRPHARRVRRGMTPMAAWKAAVMSLVIFCLLASGSLVKAARGQRDSWQRNVSLDAAQGVDRVANFLSLNRPYDWVNGELGRSDEEPTVRFPPTTVPLTPGTSTTTIPPRVISAADPLRVQVFGDSQGYNIGYVLKSETADDPLISADFDAKVSSGLARPDFYNWPARVQESLVREDADVAVIMVGANDDQNLMSVAGERVAVENTPEWDAEYRRRAAGMMDVLNNGKRKIVWIGEPKVGVPKLDAALQKINAIVQEEAALRPWVSFVETSSLLAGPNGEYVDYFTPKGKPAVKCRYGDRVHLTTACVEIVVDQVLLQLVSQYPQLVPATTTTVPVATTLPGATTAPAVPATPTTR
jgi:hypothetical protein